MKLKKSVKFLGLFVFTAGIVAGCSGKNGSNGVNGTNGTNGTNGAPGISTGSLSGTIVDSATQSPVANATVALNPAVVSTLSTDANGNFIFTDLPIGPYRVIVSASGYNQLTSGFISVAAGLTATTTLSLTSAPVSPSLITWPSNYYVDSLDTGIYNVGYGGTVHVTANVSDPDYSASALTYTWTVQSYPQYGIGNYPNETQIAGADTASLAFTTDPILTQLTPRADRDNIMPIAPYEVGLYRLILYVTNPAGVQTSSSIMIRSASKQPGIQNVAVGAPVYLNFVETTPSFNFGRPAGSSAALFTVTAAPPTTVVMFTPDVAGVYDVTETTSGNTFTIVAGTWEGVGHPVSGGYSNCFNCHNGSLTGNFAPWSQTAHASMFTRGIDGLFGDGTIGPTGYEPIDEPPFDGGPLDQVTNEVCLSCHTLGYDQAAPSSNNGFNNAMKAWAFPDVLQTSNWTNMEALYPTVSALANIQCESCHGPNVSYAHGSSPQDLLERVNWRAGVCYQCHDGQGPDWVSSPHANLQLSLSEGTIQGMGTNAAHCGRCHSAQGFGSYLDQISAYGFTGATNVLGFGTMSTAQLAALGLTVSQVQPQSCAACHDPHDATNPKQLRVYDTTMVAAGFTVQSAGAGAVCMQCHNTRNNLHNESVSLTAYGQPYVAPHTPSQTDILMGQNSYFTGITGTTTIYVSKHANIADTCVTCHMTYNPNGSSMHVWTINPQDKGALCQNCHGSGVTGDGLQTEVQGLLNQLEAKLGGDVAAAISFSMSASGGSYTVWAGSQQV
ncbi:MAG: carboxypeptidase regulatory-like domain-containing protein, partial [Deltaproteobacteria bacterium]|nr:carboxypeptidase regulatory-like domain-containing protein [Deltaproteobacteria bacterium]